MGPFHWLVVCLVALATMLDGYDTFIPGMSIVGALVGGLVADRYLGARRGLMVWCGLGVASALLMAFTGSLAGNVIAIAGAGLFIVGGQFLLNNVCAVTYPVQASGTGEGLMLGVGRAGGILGPYLGGGLLGAFGGTSVLFVAVAAAAALAVVSVSFVAARGQRVRPSQGVTA